MTSTAAVLGEAEPEANTPPAPAAVPPVAQLLDRQLRGTVARALGWQSMGTLFVQVVQSGTTLAMAAAITPGEFAIWGIASVLLNAQYLLAGLGLGSALIYYQDDRTRQQEAIDGATAVTAGLGLACAVAFLAAAPLMPAVFRNGFAPADVIHVTRVMSIVVLCMTLTNVPMALIERTMNFRRRAIPDVIGVVTYAGLGWVLLRSGWGVWSLIYGRAAQSVLLVALYWWLAPMRPRFPPRMHWEVTRQLLHYGKFMSAAAITGFLIGNLDNVAVGHFAGATALGAYTLAYAVCNLVPTFMTQTLGKVSFPLYASLRRDIQSLREAFAIAMHYLGVAILPTTAALVTIVPAALIAIFGSKWGAAAPVIPILALCGASRAVNSALGTALAATGRPGVGVWLNGPTLIVTGLALWPLAPLGAVGVAWAFTAGQLTATAIAAVMTRKYWSVELLRQVWPSVLASAGAAAITVALGMWTHAGGLVQLVAFTAVYGSLLVASDARIRGLVGLAAHPAAGDRPWRIVYFGLYADDYPRNNMLRRGLRTLGVEVIECRSPMAYAPSHFRGATGRGLGWRRVGFEARELWLALARVGSLVRQFLRVRGPIDAIILPEFNQGLAPIAALLALPRRTPLIMDFTLSLYDTAVNDRRALSRWSPRAMYRWFADAAAIRLSRRVLVETTAIGQQFDDLFGGMGDKARESHIGAPEWRFRPRPLPVRDGRPLTVLYYGNFVPLHGVEFVIQAARELRGDPRFRFVFAGAGQMRDQALATYEADPSDNVEFLGRVSDARLDELLAECDVCCGIFGTSRKALATVSNKVWQGLAVGRPVITGDGPGAAGILRSEEHCLLVPHGDGVAIADALRRLADDPALASRVADNGARLVQERFTSTEVARSVLEIVTALHLPAAEPVLPLPLPAPPAPAASRPEAEALERRQTATAPPAWYPRLAAVVAALIVLGTGLYVSAHKSIWLDEAYALDTARRAIGETFHRALYFELQGPLYFVLLNGWLRLAPAGLSTIAFARLLSTLCAVATIGVLYKLVQLLPPRRSWLSLPILAALCTQLLWAASESRNYSLTILLTALLAYTFARIWLRGTGEESVPAGPAHQGAAQGQDHLWRDGLAYVVVAYLGILNLYHVGFLVAGFAIAALFVARDRRSLRLWLTTHAALAAALLPWVPVILRQMAFHPRNKPFTGVAGMVGEDAAHTLHGIVLWIARTLAGGILRGTGEFVLYPPVIVGLAVLAAATVAARVWRRPVRWTKPEIAFMIATALTAAILLVARGFDLLLVNQSKWVIVVVGTLTALALVVAAVPSQWASRWLAGAYTLFFAGAAVTYVRTCAVACSTTDWRSVATYVQAVVHPGEPVVFAWSWDALPFQYYVGQRPPVRALSHATPWDADQWWDDFRGAAPSTRAIVLRDSLAAAVGPARTFWVVSWHTPVAEPTPGEILDGYVADHFTVLDRREIGRNPERNVAWVSVTHVRQGGTEAPGPGTAVGSSP